ncbi:MAG: T9SS type A sorting domain-containing protein [Flavobacteriaceae bacterium]
MKNTLLFLFCILAGFTTQAQFTGGAGTAGLVFTNTSPGRFNITFKPDISVKDTDGVTAFTPSDNSAPLYLHMTLINGGDVTPNDGSGKDYEDKQIMVDITGLVALTPNNLGEWYGQLNLNSHVFTSSNNTIPVGSTVGADFLIQLGTAGGASAQLTEDLQAAAYGFTATTIVTQSFVNIPDTIFEQVLVNRGIDTDGLNGKILTTDATAVTSLDVSFAGATANMSSLIADLSGIEGFTELTSLNCSGNKIRTLDLHLNTKLLVLHAEGNGMTTLNVQNGYNAVMHTTSMSNSQVGYWLTGNNLFCVTTDPFAAFSSLSIPFVPTSPPTSFHIDASVRGFSNTSCNDLDITPFLASFPAEIVTILNTQANSNGGSLTLGEVIAFVGSFDFSTIPGGVGDLSFLDAFTSITGLNLANSTFSSIDLSKYPDLANLDLTGNTSLASLDASTLSALQTLIADGNAALTQLLLTGSMTGLTTVNCPLLGEIDLSNLDQLTTLIATGNALLTSLTMPGQTPPGPKSSIANKISANTTLTTVDVQNNGLAGTLDLTNFSALTTIKVNGNNLTGLNVGNGNNANVPTANFDARNNSRLTVITVDNVAYSTTNWTNVDPGVTFSAGGVLGLDENILSSKVSVYPNPSNGVLNVNIPSDIFVSNASIFDVTGKQVKIFKSISKSLDISSLSTGIYILKIDTNKGVVSKKVLKY